MTPEERAEQVCRDLSLKSIKVTTVIPAAYGEPFTKTFEVAPIIAEAIRQARAEALEEAAKIAEQHGTAIMLGASIAAAIRERASK